MYIESFESFYQQSIELYKNDPLGTRFVTKYRHCDGKLVLKVTDDSTCLQYKTDQQADLKKVEKLNRVFFELMATGQAPPEDVDMPPTEQQQAGQQQQQQQQQRQKKIRKG